MSDPPLILHAIHHLATGGLENGLVNLINRIAPDRYRHCVLCIEDYSDFRNRIERPDVEVIALRRSTLSRIELYRRIHSICRRLRPAILHSRNLSGLDALPPALVAGVKARIHGTHGIDMDELADNAKLRVVRRLHDPLIAHHVSVSKDLARFLVERVGVSPSRITQIYNGVDASKFAPARAAASDVLPERFRGEGQVVVGTVGRLQPIKNQLALVRAFASMLRQAPNLRARARLALIGDGPTRAELDDCVRGEGLGDVTWLAGARDDVDHVYRCIDVFVLPSLREGISNTILEAMASALPIIATDVGGNAELVADGENGCLVPLSDERALSNALLRYASDRELRERQGRASRQLVLERFSLDAMVNGYLRVYDAYAPRGTRVSP